MGKNPTKRQRELLEFIKHFISEKGYGPSYREIMRGLDYKSVSTVAIHVNNLIIEGYLKKTDRSARSLEVVGENTINKVKLDEISPAQEKWLIDFVSAKFKQVEKSPDQTQVDELFVLVGALSILGFYEATESFKAKLKLIGKGVRE